MDLSNLQTLLARLSGARVLCVGDVMVDRFVYGDVTRVSPEAPIPVLARSREIVMLGAAGNVARNVAALGGEVSLIGLVGGDAEGHEAMRLVGADTGVEGFLLTDPSRPTTLKTRFVPPENPEALLTRLGPPPLQDEEAARLLVEMHRAIGRGAADRLTEAEWRRVTPRGARASGEQKGVRS
ncbi:MAG TPA: PfkB family carbohydrate kinase [Phenylobacterium sp.]|nr:PfkB family carbohydrate kinase [Phenylobacterium sp.]